MEQLYKAAAGILVAVVMILTIRKQNGEIALAISLMVCCLVGILAARFMEPVITFLKRLQNVGSLDHSMLNTLLKIVGICFITEVTELVCKDAGNEALGKVFQLMGCALILYLTLPLLTKLLGIVETILDNL